MEATPAHARSPARRSGPPRLPDFLVIGAMKAGTTSLWHALRSHPDIFTPDEKELVFFIAEKNWSRGVDWYASQFVGAGDALAAGEVSPEYTLAHAYAGVPDRIAELIPDVKLIYLLRDPLMRLRSHYLERVRAGTEDRPPERAFRENPGYVLASRYAWQLDRYLAHFRREQILLLTTEGLRDEPRETLAAVFDFLGVDKAWTPPASSTTTNTTGEVFVRRDPIKRARERWPYRAAAMITPAPLRRLHHRLTTKKLTTASMDLSDDLEAEIRAQLVPDVARLRAWMGPGFDGWGIA